MVRNAVASACVFAVAAVGLDSAAEPLVRSPESVDPILRHLPLEKERVRPEPTPGLQIEPVAGKQTVVLRAIYEKPEAPRPLLLVLRIPNEFFRRPSEKPSEVFGLNLLLKYPSMERMVELPESCLGYCDGKIFLSLENRSNAPGIRAKQLIESMARHAAEAEPLITYTQQSPAAGYDEAFKEVYVRRSDGGGLTEMFLKTGNNGEVTEYVECQPHVPSPACTFYIYLSRQPLLSIRYSHSMTLWEHRTEVRGAVLDVVERWYETSIAR
jgi:hypothetical protein